MKSKKKYVRPYITHDEFMAEYFKDKDNVAGYIKVLIEDYEKDGDREAFLHCLSSVAKAQGGISKLAKKTKLNRQNLYKALSKEGNPSILTLSKVLHALGFKLSVERI